MDEELREWLIGVGKKILTGLVIVSLVFSSIVGSYIYFGGRLEVPAQTVKIVKAPSMEGNTFSIVSKVYVNDGQRDKTFRKWPPIPGLKIGYVEKEYGFSQVFRFEEKGFFSWLKSERTQKQEDSKIVEGFVLYGEFTVKDWLQYVEMVNPAQYSLTEKEIIEREEYIGKIIRSGLEVNIEELFPVVQEEFLTRRALAVILAENLGLKTPEEIKEFIIKNVPWYWALGPNNFQEMARYGRAFGPKPGWQDRIAAGRIIQEDVAYFCWIAFEFENSESLTPEQEAFYKEVLLPVFQQFDFSALQGNIFDNSLLWDYAIKGAFLPGNEAYYTLMKELMPGILENIVEMMFEQNESLAALTEVINLKLKVKFEERPLFAERGGVDPDFLKIYQESQSN